MQYAFGSGVLYGRSLTSNTPTPVRFGALQGVTLDFAFTMKELYGQYQFPIALGRGTGKITGKADFAQFNAQAFNDIFFGLNNPANGAVRTAVAEAQTVANASATASNGATFVADLGVVAAANGAVLTRVANAPAAMQYTCNETTGVYGFANGSNNLPILLSYTYADANVGKKIVITNQLLGASPQFQAVFTETFNGKAMTVVLNACSSSKLSLVTKLEDFVIPSFDFSATADAANGIGSISLEE